MSRYRYFVYALLACALTSSAFAQDSVERFYHGGTITVLIAQGPGGGYDHYARLLMNHMPKHIPGHPSMAVQYMPGAAGVKGTNYIYTAAPKDATMICMPPYALAHIQILRGKVRYDAAKLNYLGRMAGLNGMLMVWNHAPAKTLADIRKTQVIIAAGGTSGQSYMNPTLMKSLLGLNLKVVTGYNNGAATMDLAIERGEADGRVGIWADMLIEKKGEIASGRIIPLVEVGLEKTPVSPKDVPLVADLATNQDDKTILEFMASSSAVGRFFVLPPDVPNDRLVALRRAFDATMADPALLAEAKRRNFVIEPMSGEKLQETVARTLKISPALVQKTKTALNWH